MPGKKKTPLTSKLQLNATEKGLQHWGHLLLSGLCPGAPWAGGNQRASKQLCAADQSSWALMKRPCLLGGLLGRAGCCNPLLCAQPCGSTNQDSQRPGKISSISFYFTPLHFLFRLDLNTGAGGVCFEQGTRGACNQQELYSTASGRN